MRKKRHVGEYQEFGFYVKFRVKPDPSDPDFMVFWDECILDGIEANLLCCGGKTGESWDVFVCYMDPRSRRKCKQSVTPEQRSVLVTWLTDHPRVFDLNIGPLIDAWYGPFE
ncbi:MAG: 50S ribosome-binding protein YggL [Candidatus Ozemobacteraceae bacterium]